MTTNETWELIEEKMLQLRILTNANWKNGEYELAVFGEKMLRSTLANKTTSEAIRKADNNQVSVQAAPEAALAK